MDKEYGPRGAAPDRSFGVRALNVRVAVRGTVTRGVKKLPEGVRKVIATLPQGGAK